MDINRYIPSYGVSCKHLTRIADLATEEIFEIMYATKAMKAKFMAHEPTRILQGVTVAMLFGDTSLRTRSAIEIGVHQLGGTCVDLPYNERDMEAGENITDIVNVVSRYGVGAMITRHVHDKDLDAFCAVSPLSIINSINEEYNPLQTLTDLYTIWEKKGQLEGLKIAYVGKGDNTASSLIMGAIKCGLNVAVATPPEFPLNEKHLIRAEQYGNIYTTDNPVEAVKNADIVYTDSYNYHNRLSDEDKRILQPYQVNGTLFSMAAPNATFMHPLPASRGVEVTAEIIDGKASAVLEQGENKLHVLKAILALLID